ncbi:hypothetical protein BGX28_002270 [Mortierella sp. GBA30]|nr:hypothetical protein BGX28_002270 [Mortierella sp. GBA30]
MRIPSIATLVLSLTGAVTTLASPILQKRIVGGDAVKPGELPFIAQFMHRYSPCTGFLVGPQTIVTAAHCMARGINTIVVGGTIFKEGNATVVAKWVPHPQYDKNFANDIGLVFLSRAVSGPYAQIGDDYPQPNSKITAAGFGVIDNNDTDTDVLRKVELTVGDVATCKAKFDRFYSDTQFCTTDTPLGHSVCGGDSGGPLYIGEGKDLRVVGVVNHGVGQRMCGVKGGYQYYAFIKPYVPWITMETKHFLENTTISIA